MRIEEDNSSSILAGVILALLALVVLLIIGYCDEELNDHIQKLFEGK